MVSTPFRPAPGGWRNWAGNQRADGVTVVQASGAEEIAAVVVDAAARGLRVKPLGSGHSFTAIGRPEGIAIRARPGARLRDVDPATGRARVDAGMRLRELNLALAAHGRALANLGDIDVQTVAGAVATGTHGTGAAWGGIATQVVGIELVLADGRVEWCSAQRRPDLWSAARVGLGALGVVTSVELATVPLFGLDAVEGTMPLERLLDEWDALADGSDHFEAYWFPHTGMVSTKTNTRVGTDDLAPLSTGRAWLEESLLQNTVFGAAVGLGRVLPASIPALNRVAARALGDRHYRDLSYRVFATERRVRFVEMEYAVPRAFAVDAIREVTAAVEASGMHIPFPVELRVAAADDIPLSTASGRDSAYIAVHVPAAVDPTRYFALVAGILDQVDGRPHWGKLHALDAEALSDRYPRWKDFAAVRRAVDPGGVFANAELDRVLGGL